MENIYVCMVVQHKLWILEDWKMFKVMQFIILPHFINFVCGHLNYSKCFYVKTLISVFVIQIAGRMHMWRLNIKTGKCVEERDICPLPCDFPQVPSDCVGRPCRFAYAAHFVSGFTITGIIKFDLLNETWTVLEHGMIDMIFFRMFIMHV